MRALILAEYPTSISAHGLLLSTIFFWVVAFFVVHFYNSTTEPMKDMGRPERFVMELIASFAAVIVIMVFLLGFNIALKT